MRPLRSAACRSSLVPVLGSMAAQTDRGVPLSTLCPKFLHTNSTSHTWPFSAIAELIDNAYDPDVDAKQFWIDRIVLKGQECLSFMDNGNGLNLETMHKMLSFGYSDKTPVKGVKPIGMYGNGFKSGSMRLGRDAIVFSKSESVLCVGMLSQTYLDKIGANQISVPIICFEQRNTSNFRVRDEHKASLQDILRFSPFDTQDELLLEIDAISSNQSSGKTGTRIIIWNLRSTSTETTEFDFENDRYDIRIPFDIYEAMNDTSQQPDRATSYKPECCYSLRAYCSILYLKPRMQIIIRGQKVKSQLIAKSLASVRKDHYKPTFLTKRVPINFGYNTKSKDQYGIMMYHKNRLIKAYEHVGCQLKANNKGVGVIGIIECDFLEPTHNKQSFNETDKYRKTMTSLGTKLEEYWNEIRYSRNREDPNCTTPVEDTMKRPDQNWVQCDDCLKWRKLPDGIDCDKLPDKWYCYKNPDPQFRSCQADQEPVDSDDEQPSYRKTYKQQMREKKERQKIEEARKHREEQHLAILAKQKQAHRQLQTAHPPSTSTTSQSRINTMSPQRGTESSVMLSQAACSPSSSGLPVIVSVCSLSPATPRGKRTQPVALQTVAKKRKINGVHPENRDTSKLVDASPPNSPSLLIDTGGGDDDDDDDNDDDTDDDIFILETDSTPKPVKSAIDLTKVKTEQEERDASMGMLLECNDDAAVDYASDTNVAGTSSARSAAVGTSPFPKPHTEVTSSTTQTEVPKVKEEKEDHSQTEGEERAGHSTSVSTDTAIGVCSIKQENSGESHSENQGKQASENGVTHHPDSIEEAGPSSAKACEEKGSALHQPNLAEVQEQQDQLVELMQITAMERDSFKEQVHKLTCQLKDMQSKLQELTHEKEVLLAATETKPCTAQGEKNNDEIALQVDNLMRELDQRNNERDNLRSQLDSLEKERDYLAIDCAELRLSLHQQREKAQERRTADCAVQTEELGETANSGSDLSSDTTRSLIELRHNIGRLLISYMPALDLGQVNYECNVIDEILEQYLSDATNGSVNAQ